MPELIFATLVKGRVREVIKNVRLHAPHADRSIVIVHTPCQELEDFLSTDECKQMNVEFQVIDVPYHPPTLRNAYLSKLPVGSWCFHMDSDEFLEEPACYQLRGLMKLAEDKGVDRLAFNAHDIRIGLDGVVWDNRSNYYNPIFFKVYPGICWAGETHGGIHTPGIAPRIAQVEYRYFHIKTTASEFLRGCNNYTSTGSVAQNDTSNPVWREFKVLCAKYGMDKFVDIYPKMVDGTFPEELKQWIIMNRDSDNSEARSWFVCYFGLMHPEQNIYLAGNRDLPYDKDRKPYTGEMTW